jgi:dynein heavy chain, axonemal
METLERLMKSVFAPFVLNNSSWPDTIRKDLAAATHRFMSGLVQRVNERKGNTVLYIPDMRRRALTASGLEDKDVLRLIETCVIHATRQVKEVLSKQDDVTQGGRSGPLDEIAFWRARSTDLSKIRDQLDSPECQHIVQVWSCFCLCAHLVRRRLLLCAPTKTGSDTM